MKYAQADWKQERASWRAVVQLNLIRSVLTIVDTLQAEMDHAPLDDPSRSSSDSDYDTVHENDPGSFSNSQQRSNTLTEDHQVLRLRLGPLRRVEADLKRRLGAGADEIIGGGGGVTGQGSRMTEFCVRGWKDAFEGPAAALHREKTTAGGRGRVPSREFSGPDEATEVIARCKEDIVALWGDDAVREVLHRRRMSIEDSAGL